MYFNIDFMSNWLLQQMFCVSVGFLSLILCADMLRSFFECHHWLCAQVTAVADVLKSCEFYRWFWAQVTKNMYGINNNSSGVVLMYVTTSVTHKHEVHIDLLTFIQIVNNFALEPYSKLCSIHNWFVNRCLPNFRAFRRGQLCLE